MVPVGTEQDEERVKVTYNVTYVKHSSVSVNCKTKKSICGYTGTFGDFMDTLEADSFVEAHGHEQPEYVYSFLARLIYGGIYAFSHPSQATSSGSSPSSIPAVTSGSHVRPGRGSWRLPGMGSGAPPLSSMPEYWLPRPQILPPSAPC